MERSPTVATIDWGRVAERLSFLFPPVIGVGIVGLVQDVEPGVPGLGYTLVLIGTIGYTILTGVMVVTLAVDARAIRSQPSSRTDWRPRPLLYALGALFWAPAVAVIYLYRRHRRFPTPLGWSKWWIVVFISLLTTIGGAISAIVGIVFATPELVVTAISVTGIIAVGTFPVAIHQDAAYVAQTSDSWQPNPAGYLGLALLSLFIPPLQPLLAVYYLIRRRRAIGNV